MQDTDTKRCATSCCCRCKQPASLCVQIDKCFGFDTAVEEAQEALLAAKVESSSAYHGIGVVKLMGRSSGFIAMQASLASGTRATAAAVPCEFSMTDVPIELSLGVPLQL